MLRARELLSERMEKMVASVGDWNRARTMLLSGKPWAEVYQEVRRDHQSQDAGYDAWEKYILVRIACEAQCVGESYMDLQNSTESN